MAESRTKATGGPAWLDPFVLRDLFIRAVIVSVKQLDGRVSKSREQNLSDLRAGSASQPGLPSNRGRDRIGQ